MPWNVLEAIEHRLASGDAQLARPIDAVGIDSLLQLEEQLNTQALVPFHPIVSRDEALTLDPNTVYIDELTGLLASQVGDTARYEPQANNYDQDADPAREEIGAKPLEPVQAIRADDQGAISVQPLGYSVTEKDFHSEQANELVVYINVVAIKEDEKGEVGLKA